MKTQWERVLEVLEANPNGVSQMELNTRVGLPSTSKRISDLRDRGFVIDCEPVEGKDFGRYVLVSYPENWGEEEWPTEQPITPSDTKDKSLIPTSLKPEEKGLGIGKPPIESQKSNENQLSTTRERIMSGAKSGVRNNHANGLKKETSTTCNDGDSGLDFTNDTPSIVEKILYRCPRSNVEELLPKGAWPVCGCVKCNYHYQMVRVPSRVAS